MSIQKRRISEFLSPALEDLRHVLATRPQTCRHSASGKIIINQPL